MKVVMGEINAALDRFSLYLKRNWSIRSSKNQMKKWPAHFCVIKAAYRVNFG
jgi:hypothetical protein